MSRKPDFFIVGAPKCGTTALDHYLSAHPEIFMARKEMHFFGRDLRFAPQFYRRNQDAYLAEFDARTTQLRAGESSVWYLFSETAAMELRAFNPDARVIILLREPAAMLYSLYHQFLYDGNEHLPTFERALAAEDDRRASRRTTRQTYLAQGLVYRDAVRYARQVERYFEVFGRDRVHVILYDDLEADADAVYRDVLKFLGVGQFRIESGIKVINGNKNVKNPALRTVLNDPLLRSAVLAVRPCLPQGLFNALQKTEAWLRRLNSRPAARAPLAPELRRQLQQQFEPEVKRLGELLDRDLSGWNRNEPCLRKEAAAPATVLEPAVLVAARTEKLAGVA